MQLLPPRHILGGGFCHLLIHMSGLRYFSATLPRYRMKSASQINFCTVLFYFRRRAPVIEAADSVVRQRCRQKPAAAFFMIPIPIVKKANSDGWENIWRTSVNRSRLQARTTKGNHDHQNQHHDPWRYRHTHTLDTIPAASQASVPTCRYSVSATAINTAAATATSISPHCWSTANQRPSSLCSAQPPPSIAAIWCLTPP